MADHCCPWWMNYIIGNPLRRWLDAIGERDAVRRGCAVPADISSLLEQSSGSEADEFIGEIRSIVTGSDGAG